MSNKRTRRPNGAGSLKRRSDGKGWEARLRLPDGRRLTRKVATEREGRSVLADWKKRYRDYTAPVAVPELTHELPELNAAFLMERLGELLAADERLGRIRPKTRADISPWPYFPLRPRLPAGRLARRGVRGLGSAARRARSAAGRTDSECCARPLSGRPNCRSLLDRAGFESRAARLDSTTTLPAPADILPACTHSAEA